MAYTSTARREISKVNSDNLPVVMLEIDDDDLVAPVRIVNDTRDIEFESNTYTALGFNMSMPTDLSKGLPRASLSIVNVGKELVKWLEKSNGGNNTTVRIIQVLRSTPSIIEIDITMGLTNINVTRSFITGELGFEDLLNIPAVTIIYSPEYASGIF